MLSINDVTISVSHIASHDKKSYLPPLKYTAFRPYFINVHGGEGHEGVDHGGGDVLLHNGHDQVEAHHHLHRPSGQEHRPDPRGPREVQLVTKSRGQPEIVYVTSETNFRQI